jgi:hypothetical protein
MYNLPEYIAARRATSIVKSFIVYQRQYHASTDNGSEDISINLVNLDFSSVNKELIFINAKLKKLIEICSPGAICKRFLFVEPSSNIIIPLFLFETFEPSHCYIPIVITNRSILMISPFGVSSNGSIEWIRELMPTFTLQECKTDEDLEKLALSKLTYKDNNESKEITVIDAIRLNIEYFMSANQSTDKVITEAYFDVNTIYSREVSPDDPLLAKFSEKHEELSMESIMKITSDSTLPITEYDYIPIEVTTKDGNIYNSLNMVTEFEGNTVIKNLTPSPIDDYKDDPILYLPIRDKGSVLLYLDSHIHYVGQNKVSIFNPLSNNYEEPVDMYEIFDEDFIPGKVSNEGFIGDIFKTIKIFGVRSGSLIYNMLVFLTKAPKKAFGFLWRTLKNTPILKSKIEFEKEEALRIQEKVLNDELDHGEEKMNTLRMLGLRGFFLTAITGTIIFLPWILSVQRRKLYSSRLKSVERVEYNLDAKLERLEHAYEAARNENNQEQVQSVLSQIQLVKFAKLKLIEYKREIIKKERIKYRTFDKDDTLTTRQRIDKMVSSGGFYNLNGEYGAKVLEDDGY